MSMSSINLKNKTKNKTICSDLEVRESFLGQAVGLMFSKRKNLMFVFGDERRFGLTNWFVFYSIDLVFLDSQKKVVLVKQGFKPFTFHPGCKARYVIELAKVKADNIAIGDQLSF